MVSREGWTLFAGLSLLAATAWLRAPSVLYLAATAAATLVAALLAPGMPDRGRWWAAAMALLLGAFCVAETLAQRDLARMDMRWPDVKRDIDARSDSLLSVELDATVRTLRTMATRALSQSQAGDAAFDVFGAEANGVESWGVVLLRSGIPVAWGGRIYTTPDTLRSPVGVVFGPFYVTVFATAERGTERAVATAVVHSEPPADRIAAPLDDAVAHRAGALAYAFVGPDSAVPGSMLFSSGGRRLLRFRALLPNRGEARLARLTAAESAGARILAVALLIFLLGAWRANRALAWRILPVVGGLGCLAILPLNSFSSVSPFFDPTVYIAEIGGPFSSSVATLALSAALALLGLLVAFRSSRHPDSRALAVLVVLGVMAGGPFLMRSLASGVTPPPGGTPIVLWVGWEVALFLVAAVLLIAAAAAGSAALRGRRGLPAVVPVLLAMTAGILGPLTLRAPVWWPDWYSILWVVVVGVLALTKDDSRLLLTAAAVAAIAAATITWNAGVRGRVTLANRDVAGLNAADPYVPAALSRFAERLARGEGPPDEPSLLREYVQSDLAGTGYPVQLAHWERGVRTATVQLASFVPPEGEIAQLVHDVGSGRTAEVRRLPGVPGHYVVLAVPHAGGDATTVTVAPRTRLIPEGRFNRLLGLPPTEQGEPPYALSLVDLDSSGRTRTVSTRWDRQGSELHGDRVVETSRGAARAHIEVELRSLGALIQRGTLIVLLDLLVLLTLWILSVLPDGALLRWLRRRVRRWTESYRARLTLALFAFFVLPAALFAAWSYARIHADDRQSRELIVRETLQRAVTMNGDLGEMAVRSDRPDAPLMLFRGGELRESTDRLQDALAPIGRLLAPGIYLSLARAREVDAAQVELVGATRALFGYRAAVASDGEKVVLASPARGNDEVLDQRRRDLGVLVLFSTVIGALAALWLSGIAARSLAQPIGRLRQAALAIARGEREPHLAGSPPVEFVPVFSAFRRMAADLGESQSALEAAQRRTASVLRNVASGVLAVDRSGRLTLANPPVAVMLGYTPESGTVAAALRPAELATRLRAFLDGERDDEEFEMEVDGRQLQARLTRLGRGGGGGAVLTLDDVTELARAQRVLAWGEMARQVAHEIKNPLTPIRLGVQHLKRAHADDRVDFDQVLEQNVSRILAEIDHLDEIARSFSRYGGVPGERLPAESVDVSSVARSVLELERLGTSGVEWRLQGADSSIHASCRADELREVLLNVLENARLADAEEIELAVRTDEDRVVIEIRDDGRGIPSSVMPKIFEPHFSTRTSGSGLGLAISRQLVEGWGGEMAIDSTETVGTTIRISLRRADKRDSTPPPRAAL
ncbi:MAG: ATP-binding protein [Gemmatimonadota bacterium]|nr:ATP-binding protein [Gemmatimonadota bacterium]